MSDVDYYKVLGVPPTASKSEIKKAYKNLALRYHPDKNSSVDAEENFKSIQKAYQILSDDTQRKIYDLKRPRKDENSSQSQTKPQHHPQWDFSSYFQKRTKQRELSEKLRELTEEYSKRVTDHNSKRERFNRSKAKQMYVSCKSKGEDDYYVLQVEFYENETVFFEKEIVFCELQISEGILVDFYEKEIEQFEKKMEHAQRQAQFYRQRATHYTDKRKSQEE